MRCERHGLAAGPDGKCALCHSEGRKFEVAVVRQNDRARKVAIVVVAVACGIAAFILLTVIFDTKK
jgi:hypothetical protein